MGGLLFDDALPLKQIFSLCFIQMCDFINAGAIYPYIIFMVQSFELTTDERKLGYYAGLLASSYYFAQLLSSLLWGIASDKFGRRPCLLLGLFFSLITVVLFGFSTSLRFAIATRFLSGFLNGNVGITKTMLGEISTSETQARAFSYFGFTIGISGIVGPLIGGTLSKPSEKYHAIFGGVEFFEKYPFCLPNLVVGGMSVIGFIAGIFFLPETKKWGPGPGNPCKNGISALLSKLSFFSESPKFIKLQELDTVDTTTSLGDDEPAAKIGESEGAQVPPSTTIAQSLAVLRKDRGVVVSCALYGILGFMYVFYEEMVPYWAFLDVELGGLGFNTTDNGIFISIGCIIGILFQLLVYPKIANKLGILKAFRLGISFILLFFIFPFPFYIFSQFLVQIPFDKLKGVITLPGFLLLPQTGLLTVWLTSNTHLGTNPVTWIFLVTAILFIQVGGELLFVCVMISISNSAVPEMMGTVNGLAQSFVALTRSFAPVLGGSLLSWSLTNGFRFPFNFQFPFLVLVLIGVTIIGLSLLAPPSLNIQKKEALQKEAEKLLNEDL